MTNNDIHNAVVKALTQVQELSGRAAIKIDGNTCPIGDLEGFDSLNAVETAGIISGYIGHEVQPKTMLSSNPNKPLRVSDIVTRIFQSINDDH
ncbi:MAG: hypothetical protein AAF639_35185 [Chloroflexota bacterium]